MTDYSDPDVDAIVGALHRLRSRRHDVTAALAVALHEAGTAYRVRDDLFGQFDDVYDNVHVLELMDVGRRYTRDQLAQFQVQAGLDFMEGRNTDVGILQAELDLPDSAMNSALAAEVARGAAVRTSTSTYRCTGAS